MNGWSTDATADRILVMVYEILGVATLAANTLFTVQTARSVRRHASSGHVVQGNTNTTSPSVSVCIAARNETHALSRCLEAVLASSYEKMEILVLDDGSADETPNIIKSFAHAGVRFIAGTSLAEGWTGRNHAYQTLLDAASGSYVLFMDVDTHIASHTIRTVVNQVQRESLAMISVMPYRDDSYRASALFGTLRYHWELIVSSRKRPPASSAFWMIHRATFQAIEKGFSNYPASTRPERHFARQLYARYRYDIPGRALGVSYEKRLSSQYETSARVYYPLTGKRLVSSSGAFALLFGMSLSAPLTILGSPLAAVSLIVGLIGHILFVRFAQRGLFWMILRVVAWPILVAQELFLFIRSVVLYHTKSVTWKGRLLTAPLKSRDDVIIRD